MTNWKITFPIEKAEKRDDGLFITGLASGPEIDAQGERMDGELITRFADQINSTGGLALSQRLVYRDAHAPDGVLRDLGWIHKAWVNKDQRLAVEVKLDEENPAATYLFKQINKGKQYGMSVAGKVLDFADEFITDVGSVVRTYMDIILTEISNTTRPAWTPSFGSVLAKALMDAEDGAPSNGADTPALAAEVETQGEHMSEETLKAEREVEIEVVETPDLPVGDPTPDITDAPGQPEGEPIDSPKSPPPGEPVDVDKTDDPAGEPLTPLIDETDESASDEPDTEVVEPAPTPETPAVERAAVVAAVNELGKAFAELTKALTAYVPSETAIETAPAADSADEGETLATKADTETPDEETTPEAPSYEDLARTNAEQAERIAALEGAPPTQLPPIVERAVLDTDEFRKGLAELPREGRLRAVFAGKTGGK